MTGGASKKKGSKSKVVANKKGGRVAMPLEYFGGVSNRYFEDGAPELMTQGNSVGSIVDTFNNVMPSNLMPHIAGTGATDIMTGGYVSILNKKVFSSKVKDILQKSLKSDANITDQAVNKLRVLTEMYVMNKLT